VRLAGHDDAHRALGVLEDAPQTRRIGEQQVRALVGREAPSTSALPSRPASMAARSTGLSPRAWKQRVNEPRTASIIAALLASCARHSSAGLTRVACAKSAGRTGASSARSRRPTPGPVHDARCTPLVIAATGTSGSSRPGQNTCSSFCDATPCILLTPLTKPAKFIAR
jgi:hypothetical protein